MKVVKVKKVTQLVGMITNDSGGGHFVLETYFVTPDKIKKILDKKFKRAKFDGEGNPHPVLRAKISERRGKND